MSQEPKNDARQSERTEGAAVGNTAALLSRVRLGDMQAREELCAAYLPILKRWAQGRLPGYARNVSETDDLVQVTLIAAFQKLDEFEPRREGAFLAYLRQILLNAIRKEIRTTSRRPVCDTLSGALPDSTPSVVEQTIGLEMLDRYERGLSRLSAKQKEAIILRVEFGFKYNEIAKALECSSADAARMLVGRALARLAEVMA